MHCVGHGSCVSVNYKTSGVGNGRYELKNVTLQDTSDEDSSTCNPDYRRLYIIEKVREEETFSNKHKRFKLSNKFSNTLLRFDEANKNVFEGKSLVSKRSHDYSAKEKENQEKLNDMRIYALFLI